MADTFWHWAAQAQTLLWEYGWWAPTPGIPQKIPPSVMPSPPGKSECQVRLWRGTHKKDRENQQKVQGSWGRCASSVGARWPEVVTPSGFSPSLPPIPYVIFFELKVTLEHLMCILEGPHPLSSSRYTDRKLRAILTLPFSEG